MDYKSFKSLISDIGKEKEEMEEKLKNSSIENADVDIDISTLFS